MTVQNTTHSNTLEIIKTKNEMEDRSHVREDAILTKKQNHENVILDKLEQNSKNQMARLEESKRNEREHNTIMEDKKNNHEVVMTNLKNDYEIKKEESATKNKLAIGELDVRIQKQKDDMELKKADQININNNVNIDIENSRKKMDSHLKDRSTERRMKLETHQAQLALQKSLIINKSESNVSMSEVRFNHADIEKDSG